MTSSYVWRLKFSVHFLGLNWFRQWDSHTQKVRHFRKLNRQNFANALGQNCVHDLRLRRTDFQYFFAIGWVKIYLMWMSHYVDFHAFFLHCSLTQMSALVSLLWQMIQHTTRVWNKIQQFLLLFFWEELSENYILLAFDICQFSFWCRRIDGSYWIFVIL